MTNFKKIILALGSATAIIAPVAGVVACSSNTTMGDDESKILNFLKSANGKEVLATIWAEKAIEDIASNNSDYNLLTTTATSTEDIISEWRKELTKAFIVEKLKTEPNFLVGLSNAIFKIDGDATLKTNLLNAGFNSSYLTTNYATASGNIITDQANFDLLYPILNAIDTSPATTPTTPATTTTGTGTPTAAAVNPNAKFSQLGFAQEINRLIIVKAYLSLNKAQWEEVFASKNADASDSDDVNHTMTLSTTEEKIDEGENFILNKYALENKFGFQWEISLTDSSDTFAFRSQNTPFDSTAAIAALTETTGPTNTTVADFGTYSEKNAKYHDGLDVFVAGTGTDALDSTNITAFKAMSGYRGLVRLPVGEGQLDFDQTNLLDAATTANKDWGFIWDKDITDTDIQYYDGTAADPNAEPVKLTAVIAALPRVNEDGKLTLNPLKDAGTSAESAMGTVEFDLDILSTMFAVKSPNLFADAMTYFTNRKIDPIEVEVHDQYIQDMLEDEGIGYIK